MASYRIASGTRVVARAKSSIHDTNTTWDKATGTITADASALSEAAASVTVDMRAFDAGDFLKNRKLKKDLAVADHPEAVFELSAVTDIVDAGDKFEATARGVIRWRGREAQITARGTGRLDDQRLEASASFDLDVRDLGVTPPKILMFKVDPVVTVDVTLVATTG